MTTEVKTTTEVKARFDYDHLEPLVREKLLAAAFAVKTCLRRLGAETVEIGRQLLLAKQLLGPRDFNVWLLIEFQWSYQSAVKFMRISEVFGDLDCVQNIHPSALYVMSSQRMKKPVMEKLIATARAGDIVTARIAEDELRAHLGLEETSVIALPDRLRTLKSRVKKTLEELDPGTCMAFCGEMEELLNEFQARARWAIEKAEKAAREAPAGQLQPA